MIEKKNKLFNWILILSVLTIVYNIIEGLVAISFGIKDETLTLFGFGADSFVETVSAIGVTQMIIRIKKNPQSDKGEFETLALKITAWCFYVLALILTVSAIYNVAEGNQPSSAIAGVVISSISIIAMWVLIRAKISLGTKLNSPAIIADAKCNQICMYMSLILLATTGLWWLWKIPYIDAIGAAGIVYFSIKEGKEAFNKAKGIECGHCDHD
ncbi:MAG: hypothetical protein COB15_09895 [Flavobacteriales bacterium]|nr:MAG: hypothetical protein COB15_09895 [Flavobacteriales bacterium]